MLWSGALSSVPAGWKICDGSSGTPDLRDRFVLGAGLSYQPLDTGGSMTHTHSIGPYVCPGWRQNWEPTPGYVAISSDFQTTPSSSLPPYAALFYIMKV